MKHRVGDCGSDGDDRGFAVTALIDFGAMQIDTPATDVARLLGSFVGDDANGWREGLAAYSAVRSLSDQESLAVFALDKAGTILAGCNWIRWVYVEQREFTVRSQIEARFQRIADRACGISLPQKSIRLP